MSSQLKEADELVTVVVPARDEEASISRCLDSVLAQTWTNLEVFVVDGDSSDATADVVERYASADARVVLLHNPRRLIPVSLNLALARSGARWLVRVDAHAEVPPDYVSTAVAHLQTGAFGAVGGRKDGRGRTAAGRAVAAAMASRFGVGGSKYHWGTTPSRVDHVPFGCYPTELLRELGGWDEELAVNQDFELDRRVRLAGYDILFDPDLRIDWECRQSVPALFRQYRRYGRGKVAVAAKHPRSLRLRHMAAPLMVVLVAVSALLALRSSRAGALAVSPYVAGLAAATAEAGRELDRDARSRLPLAFLAMHLGWGIGFWEGVAGLVRDHVVEIPATK